MRARFGLTVALAALASLGVVGPGAGVAVADVTPSPLLAAARLSGPFVMTGTVTKAVGVPQERPGDIVRRTWTFIPLCETGACANIELLRARAGGTDRVLLQRRGPALYSGVGTFLAPTHCHGRSYRKGALVPFTLTVRIVVAAPLPTGVQATGVAAVYRNRKRINLTKCFAAPSYDSARYLGAPPAL
jgi:hypothetical protein